MAFAARYVGDARRAGSRDLALLAVRRKFAALRPPRRTRRRKRTRTFMCKSAGFRFLRDSCHLARAIAEDHRGRLLLDHRDVPAPGLPGTTHRRFSRRRVSLEGY